ncbi:MAG: InlB B-repeat-containing protein [Clostridia bacterium]|nr:InlB B-repeat-containing protein [Clostridia bacterium]
MTKKFTAWTLIITLLLSLFAMQITGFAEDGADLDLSPLSEITETTSENGENYSYTWTVEEIDEETVRTLELTLDGANIKTLTLPCRSYGELHVIINTVSDSKVEEITGSYVFSYSYQWNSITFKGEGNLKIDSVSLQGGDNNHIITVAKDASVEIYGEYASLSFGASGSSNSTLNVDGTLSVNGNVNCGNVKIAESGHLKCKRVIASGDGAFDTDENANAFVMEDGGKLEALGDNDWIDDATGESYGALVVCAMLEDEDVSTVIVLPDGYLPEGYSVVKTEHYVTVDDGDENPVEETSFDAGVIYAAGFLTLPKASEKYIIIFENEDGTELQKEEMEVGETPVYTGETPTKPADEDYTYTFVGWTPDIEEVTESKTYTAVFDAIPILTTGHTVIFDSKGGSDIENATVADGEMLEKPINPTKSGYRFKGWFIDEELTDEYDFTGAVTSSFTLYAKWQKRQSSTGSGSGGGTSYYSIRFDTGGGNEIKYQRIARNSKLQKPEDPTKSDYIFDGWYVDEECTTTYDFETKVTKSFTLYAKWRQSNVSDILNVNEHFAYVKGYEDATVRPNDYITRAETTEIFFRLLEEDTRSKNIAHENSFLDADENAWYNTSVSTMAKLGIIKGRALNLFAPDSLITRGEFAAICARFDNSDFEIANVFSDTKGHWAESEIAEATAHGWIKGYEDESFRPDEYITRAEAIALINRMTGRTPKSKEDLHENMTKWIDNSDEDAWYYIAIQEATNSHDYIRDEDENEKWTAVNR